jgi:transcriptional regulator of met regulon
MNNDTAIEAVLKHFFLKWLVKKRTSRRLRCLKHIINLAAKVFLYNKEADAFEKDIESFKEKSDLLKELTL